MTEYVKIEIMDEGGKILKHHYLRINEWKVPGGIIEKDETPLQAAVRELLERTGYKIDPINLERGAKEIDSYVFKGYKKDLVSVAKPGEKGGYSTEIRWD